MIKMITKSRSPTIRHVSRPHRVALEKLFDRINLDPKIQIKYVDTEHQLADILAKGNFTRDEWNNLLYLYNISHFSSLLRSEFQLDQLHQNDGEEVARTRKRQQDRGRVKADDEEPGRLCLDQFFDCKKSDCVEKIRQAQGNLTREIAITTQRRVLKDDKKMHFWTSSTGKPVATEEDPRTPECT